MALVNRNADVDAGCKACAEPSTAAPGLPPVADEIALRAGPGPDSVGLGPGPETRRVRRFGGAAAARIVPQRAAEPVLAWFPRRSRKLLPRFVTVAPADRSELISVGDGVGGGVGGGGVGGGRGALCA